MKLKWNSAALIGAVVLLFGSQIVRTAGTTVLSVLPSTNSGIGLTNAVGVTGDAAPGFNHGSLKSNGSAKSEYYVTPESLFNREIDLSEIEVLSYYTKKGTDHVAAPADWYINIYTKPYVGDVSSAAWYGDRIGAEPYFSANLSETAGAWNQWSSDAGSNQLRFFESTLGYFGGYADPHWPAFVADNGLSGQARATQKVLFISLQTGSAWVAGFNGQVDGLNIELADGSIAKINFEPHVVASDRDSCKKDRWTSVFRIDGSPFSNQGDCVSYVSAGK